jgi:hypothetical protein
MLESTAALGTESNALFFRWAMGGRVYTKTGNGYYYDVEGVRYRCSGKEGQYTYEQVASVFEANNDHVSSPAVNAMVSKAIDYVTADTPPRSPTPPELQLLYDCGTPPHKGQDKVPTQSSQAAAPASKVAIQWDVHNRRGGGPLSGSWVPPMFFFLIVLIILHMYLGKYLYME